MGNIPDQQFYALGKRSLATILRLKEPPFARDGDDSAVAFRQLAYVERYVRDLGCRTILVERGYIDRDYMEDHSVFYSRSLHPYPNRCDRVHFFGGALSTIRSELSALLNSAIAQGSNGDHRQACNRFSERHYLGFAVIKPLGGSPVGRTVVRCFDSNCAGHLRDFESSRPYFVHVRGVELTVTGLAFQQQDIGVSACATTALWSSLQKARDFEKIAAATPAQITRLASQYTLPFGRPMPSEGLGVDQMCIAVQSLGLAPNLFRIEDFETARGYIYSAARSGFAPVLILKYASAGPAIHHAVTVAGVKIATDGAPALISGSKLIADRSGGMAALYIHDDRNGPNLRADVAKHQNHLELAIDLHRVAPGVVERWVVTHLLVPMHSKVRISFSSLRQIAWSVVLSASAKLEVQPKKSKEPITFDTWIERGHVYLKRLIASAIWSATQIESFTDTYRLPRYVGVVSLEAPAVGTLHVLVDTTSTAKNLNFIAVVRAGPIQRHTAAVARLLARECACTSVI